MTSLEAPTLNNTVGALLISVVGASLLYGTTTLQAYWYYHHYPRDSLLHKISIATLWALDTIHLAMIVHALYLYVISGFGNNDGLDKILWSIKAQIAISVVVVLLVQSLYAHRVWILGGYHRGILGYFVVIIVLAGFAVGLVLAVKINTIDSYLDIGSIGWSINASLATTTATDFLIAGAMCYYLRKSKTTMYLLLNTRISRLMEYTLSSGLFTSACSLSAMFSYILLPDTFIYLAIQFILTKLYVGSFFAMLNARQRPEGIKSDVESSTKTPLRIHFHATCTSSHAPTSPRSLPLSVSSPKSKAVSIVS